jgi:hypothetical protein
MGDANILYDRVDALRRAIERERRARLDAERAAARAGAEAGALRVEVRRLCERVEELEAGHEGARP